MMLAKEGDADAPKEWGWRGKERCFEVRRRDLLIQNYEA